MRSEGASDREGLLKLGFVENTSPFRARVHLYLSWIEISSL